MTILATSVDHLNDLENRVSIYQEHITKILKRLEKKFDYHLNATIAQVHSKKLK